MVGCWVGLALSVAAGLVSLLPVEVPLLLALSPALDGVVALVGAVAFLVDAEVLLATDELWVLDVGLFG